MLSDPTRLITLLITCTPSRKIEAELKCRWCTTKYSGMVFQLNFIEPNMMMKASMIYSEVLFFGILFQPYYPPQKMCHIALNSSWSDNKDSSSFAMSLGVLSAHHLP